VDAVGAKDGRLSAGLASTLEPKLQDALDHPLRREVMRVLNRDPRPRSVGELQAELSRFPAGQLGYHLRVLREAGIVVAVEGNAAAASGSYVRYASGVVGNSQVRAVLRATERWDRRRREAQASGTASPLLTMFRTPRPARTIRLRARREQPGSEAE
jgi:DNA-binding transcriptional ArsR family regulator